MPSILNHSELVYAINHWSAQVLDPVLQRWAKRAYTRAMTRKGMFAEVTEEAALAAYEVAKRPKDTAYTSFYCPYIPLVNAYKISEIDGAYVTNMDIKAWMNAHGIETPMEDVDRVLREALGISFPNDEPTGEAASILRDNLASIPAWLKQRNIEMERKQYLHAIDTRRLAQLASYFTVNLGTKTPSSISDMLDSGTEVLVWLGPDFSYPEGVVEFIDKNHIMDWLKSLQVYNAIAKEITKENVDRLRRSTVVPLLKLAAETMRKLDRISFKDAPAHARRWFMLLNSITDTLEDVEGLEEILKVENGTWFRLKSQQCLIREGKLMSHCVGGGSYNITGDRPTARIYSLRDADNKPCVTIETNHRNGKPLGVRQIKGYDNEVPDSKYRNDVLAFLNAFCDPVPKPCQDMLALKIVPKQSEDGFEFLATAWWGQGGDTAPLVGGRAIQWPAAHCIQIGNIRVTQTAPFEVVQGIHIGEIKIFQAGIARMQEADMVLSITEADEA